MSSPYIGEIRMFAGNFPPQGWAFCDGSLQDISQNDTLFNLIGTTYGGDGQTTFALPDLRGRVAVGVGNSYTQAQMGGAESVTLTTNQIPAHTHAPIGDSGPGTNTDPTNAYFANTAPLNVYAPSSPPRAAITRTAAGMATSSSGGSQPHENMVPFLVVNFIISLFGIFPSQT